MSIYGPSESLSILGGVDVFGAASPTLPIEAAAEALRRASLSPDTDITTALRRWPSDPPGFTEPLVPSPSSLSGADDVSVLGLGDAGGFDTIIDWAREHWIWIAGGAVVVAVGLIALAARK